MFQMRRKRKGRGRGQDKVRNEHTRPGSILFSRPGLSAVKESSWQKAARAAALSYSTRDLVEMKQDYKEHGEADCKK